MKKMESEKRDKEEDTQSATIEVIISALGNIVTEWISCEFYNLRHFLRFIFSFFILSFSFVYFLTMVL